ncbi:MAG: single-stranded-DNA-specific exonuclease RecJ [Candidatus Omnitrophota bacterium]
MRRKLWKIKELNPRAALLAKKHNISIFLAQIFLNRWIKEEDFSCFLGLTHPVLHSPNLLPDIKKAVQRVNAAVTGKEKVLVFGDYDVDGITSLAIFYEFSFKHPDIFSFHIPHRCEEGYGLNKKTIKKAAEEGVSLLIAFDCGTNAYEEVEFAGSLNIDVVIIDHHLPKDQITESFAFINPKRKDSNYPFPDLSAGALSFKFLQALTGSDCYEVLDLVALSLVCDVAPLRGENRILLKKGLEVIRKTNRLAIKALCDVGRIKQENIDIFHIGFVLGPRINASGRVAHAIDSFKLFLTKDALEARSYAFKLNEYNLLRKDIEAQILRAAEEDVKGNIKGDYAIVVSGEGWHQGVLGIVASRLADKYFRPCFVISFDEHKGKGSARSIYSVHLLEVLNKCSDFLVLYGGHARAAGVSLIKGQLEGFKEKINLLIKESSSPEDFIPIVDIDASLNFEDIELGLVEDIEKLGPYGEGNSKPLFSCFNIFKKSAPQKIRSGFSIWLSDNNRVFEGIVYDKDVLEVLNYAETFDIAFSLEKNRYHNIPRLVIRDCRVS